MAIPGLAARGPAWQQERNVERRMKEEGDDKEEAWHARALQRGTDMSSHQQQRKHHMVWNVLIREHTRCTPYTIIIGLIRVKVEC